MRINCDATLLLRCVTSDTLVASVQIGVGRVRRREFIAFVGGLNLAWQSAARAERMRQIGLLMGYAETDADTQANLAALREALQELNWAEGRNIRINIRWPIPADLRSMQRSAKELVELQPDLLLSEITPTTAALLQQTHDPDRVRQGFRSGGQRFCRELSRTRRQRHRLH